MVKDNKKKRLNFINLGIILFLVLKDNKFMYYFSYSFGIYKIFWNCRGNVNVLFNKVLDLDIK